MSREPVVAVSLKLYFDTARTLAYCHDVALGVAALNSPGDAGVTVAVALARASPLIASAAVIASTVPPVGMAMLPP